MKLLPKTAGRLVVPALFTACAMLSGCDSDNGSTTQPSDIRARQQAALRDPFGYKMQFDETVSGGGTTDLKKDELNRDLKNVLNP